MKPETREVDTILATGNGGEKIFIVLSYRLVAVFTSGNYNAKKDTPRNHAFDCAPGCLEGFVASIQLNMMQVHFDALGVSFVD